jgi:hypothetical protein
MGPGNPCDCESDGTVVGVCKECKKGLPIASPDRIKNSNSPDGVQMLNAVLGVANSYIGDMQGSPNLSASNIERCCGTQGWRSGRKVTGSMSASGTPYEGSKTSAVTVSGYGFTRTINLVKADYKVGWKGDATVSIDDDPCQTGCNSQVEFNASATASGGISTPDVPILRDLFIVSGSVNGGGNIHVTNRCGVTTANGCLGPFTATMNVNIFGLFQTIVEQWPIGQTDCF